MNEPTHASDYHAARAAAEQRTYVAPKIQAVRRLQYSIGHRVKRHESKCRNLHGHNFVFFLHAEAPELDALGRVIDFGVLKEKFDPWFQTNWDHGFLLWHDDDEAIACCRLMPGQKLSYLPYNPTAENIARFVLLELGPKLLTNTNVSLTKVVVWETENGVAEASL